MKVHVLGSCSGTEPMPGRHQTSVVLEHEGLLYWFDAGEGCGHTAFLMGLNPLQMRTLCVTHPHIDHVAGLTHLLWIPGKLYQKKNMVARQPLDVFLPNEELWYAALTLGRLPDPYLFPGQGLVIPRLIQDGVLFEEDVTIEARHNHHIPPEEGRFVSYSFRIRAAGRTIILSGDVKSILDFEPWLLEGCDLLLMETGHHSVQNVCQALREYPVHRLVFYHHGREIMDDFDSLLATARKIFARPLDFANDGSSYELRPRRTRPKRPEL